jgi:hypothetical protein
MLGEVKAQKPNLGLSLVKQIGVPPFNTGRKILPVRSGAGKLRQLKFSKLYVNSCAAKT